ncbi:forespore regulator of the sigma-K checkpoint [Terribacillus saccharophilus]|uniref:Forespore regulator of the sigma-K checkpoint n=1 Tax=Terribacillus saccharophilus TaxID=361277 RepID=A0AAX2EA28_9BACI|nr:forespore regulator of the sigma-K checkpoint [Terribacillus saccharophilus]
MRRFLVFCLLFLLVVPSVTVHAADPVEVKVVLQRQYIDGKQTEVAHQEKIYAMEDFWSTYHDWQLVSQKEGLVVFKQEVMDISPSLKKNGYFGIYKGKLTIFEGRPVDQQAIQSFYQINKGKLESHQAEELEDGIKIQSREVYEDVLEAFRSKNDIAPLPS